MKFQSVASNLLHFFFAFSTKIIATAVHTAFRSPGTKWFFPFMVACATSEDAAFADEFKVASFHSHRLAVDDCICNDPPGILNDSPESGS
jgi:hypothetical protein